MCVYFRYLNKACPKDSYFLSCVDQLVDVTSGHEVLSFMDTKFSYNQIKKAKKDALHTTFYVDNDIYHYMMIPFELINAINGWSISCSSA